MLLRVLFFITFFSAVHALICIHGSFCESDADCVPGSYCGNRKPHYSQCVPNAANASCIAFYSPCGGLHFACPFCAGVSHNYTQELDKMYRRTRNVARVLHAKSLRLISVNARQSLTTAPIRRVSIQFLGRLL